MRIPGKSLYDKQEQDDYDLLRKQKSLNVKELKNTYPVAHYVQILKKNNQLESVLNH